MALEPFLACNHVMVIVETKDENFNICTWAWSLKCYHKVISKAIYKTIYILIS